MSRIGPTTPEPGHAKRRQSGFRTSEFWLTIGILAMASTKKWTGLSFEEILTVAAVVGVYTGGRSFLKARS